MSAGNQGLRAGHKSDTMRFVQFQFKANTVFGHCRSTEFLFENYIASFRTKCNFYCVG